MCPLTTFILRSTVPFLLLLAGCNRDGLDGPGPRDLSLVFPEDDLSSGDAALPEPDLASAPDLARPTLQFAGAYDFSPGDEPAAIAGGDFNGDGALDLAFPDLAHTNPDSTTITLLLGTGDGRFAPGKSFTAGKSVCRMVAGDFNGDKRTDLALGHCARAFKANDYFDVWLGDGKGGFMLFSSVQMDGYLSAMTAYDLNGDGALDVVAGSETAGFCILYGDGHGLLKPVVTQSAPKPDTLALGDLDGDQRPDVAAVAGGTLQWWFVDAQGDFHPGGTINDTFAAVALLDYDGDGHLDVAGARGKGRQLALFHNDGSGNLAAATEFGAMDTYSSGIAVLDANGDKKPDLAVASYKAGLTMYIHRPGGTFAPSAPYPGYFSDVLVADFDGNGRADVAGLQGHDNMVRIFRTLPDGSLTNAPVLPVYGGPTVTGDWNGDGWTDIAVLDQSNATNVLLNDKKGHFGNPTAISSLSIVGSLATADFDGDGNSDLLVGAADMMNQASLRLSVGRGDGSFQPPQLLWTGRTYTRPIVADVNGDKRPDILFRDAMQNILLLRNAGGVFAAPVTLPVGCSYPRDLAVGDADQDGRIDLVVACEDKVLLRLGDGMSFGNARQIGNIGGVAAGLADLNGDDLPDLVVASFNYPVGFVALLLNAPGANFAAPVTCPAIGNVGSVDFADFDRDGHLDVAVGYGSASYAGGCAILRGDGKGHLGPPLGLAGPSGAGRDTFAIADLDNDGLPDLLLGGKQLSVVLNTTR